MNGFIPRKRGKNIIVSGKINKDIQENLERLNLNLIKTIKCNSVYDSLSYHPDIVFHPIDNENIVVAKNMYDKYLETFKDLGVNLIEGEKELGNKYPQTIYYNVGRIGNFALGNMKYVDEVIKNEYRKRNIKLVHVRQGYTKCSMAIVNENSVITADRKIYEKLIQEGIESLLIEPGYIDLYKQDYGFIGGSMGLLSKNELLISGKLLNHPSKSEIETFIKNRGVDIIYLSNGNIEDLGSLICF